MKTKIYSTEKAWEGLETDSEKLHFQKMARYFRRDNRKLREEIKRLKNAAKKDNYIETILKK
jgi:hypothetical protein|tara:strand:- start:50 stop:235 length:186 start_codon:yes stop_codon:yes gene_type:complete